MHLFFKNKGATCFFNVACQLLLQNTNFLDGITRYIESLPKENVITQLKLYDNWRTSNPHTNPKNVPQEFIQGRRFGLLIAFYRVQKVLSSQTNQNDAHIANVDEFASYIPCLYHSIRTNQHQDILECVNEIFEILTQQPIRSIVINGVGDNHGDNQDNHDNDHDNDHEDIQQIKERLLHDNILHECYGIRCETQKCSHCQEIVRKEYTPFLWISHVNDSYKAEDVQCDHCHEKADREILSRIVWSPSCILVNIARHNTFGEKIHDTKKMNTSVSILSKRYNLVSVAYHEGYTFQSGHYVAMNFTEKFQCWMYVNDASHRLQNNDFDITNFKTNCTYAGLYKIN